MKLSYNWLKEYLKCDLTPEQVAEAMTSIGIEVDSVEMQEVIPGGLKGVVVAQVLTCEPHPDSDHLHVTTVNDGTPEPVQVVCGAPNVAAGQKVLFAQLGTVLPGDFKIKKSKIRGVESFGMICAEDELGIGASHAGIMVLPEEAVVGTPAKEYLQLKDEAVIEYEITANRIDAASHIGVARDLYGYLKSKDIPAQLCIPSVDAFKEGEGESIPVEVLDNAGAPRYVGITVKGVKVGPSPEWLQERLLSIGLKPINNVVDISNFVLFETGQPLHTFDAAKTKGKVIVRRAAQGEAIRTLDGVDRKLASCDMVIANQDGPMCIAGVFGGEDSGVTESTVDVFIEGAYFDPVSIRKTAKSQQLSTDASFRFERGADPEAAMYAAKRAALLILEVAGGKVVGKVREIYPQPIGRAQIELDYARIEHFIGKEIGWKTIEKILLGLNYQFVKEWDGGALVAAPTYMVDVTRECDVVEEILRIYGYNNIELPGNLRMSVNPSQQPDPEATRNNISNWLAANGFVETMNNSLTKEDYYTKLETFPAEKCVHIVNPLSSDLNVMRQTLLLNGLEVVAYNLNRQAVSLKFFEYGSVYQRLPQMDGTTLAGYEEHRCFSLFISGTPDKAWRNPAQKSNFFLLKGYVEALMARYRIDVNSLATGAAPADLFSEGITYCLPGKEPKLLATLGTLNPVVCKRFGIKQPVFAAEINWEVLFTLIKRDKFSFKELPRFPEVRRDLALLLNEGVAYADVRQCALRAGKKLIKSVSLFDVYRGEKIPEGKKQYALNFVLQDPERTLTDTEVESTMNRVLTALQTELGATLR
ncbi:MAG: phenylalanine--tRNA ligase subunit beta [Bacteroidales bacterium]|jgi:phenylalanyl-tRNA synthetase beta chain|nr:phenylalanine--tRNA ligase subunit beta [Bacteroidales bacterium]